MTEFTQHFIPPFSTIHLALFEAKGAEYSVNLHRISAENRYDSSVIFPENYLFSTGGCWEVTFDLAENIKNQRWFQRPRQPTASALRVLRQLGKVIDDHYTLYRGGMYVFSADSKALADVYIKMIARKLGKGTTLESGLDPERRGYVIRTQRCYPQARAAR